ncbi:zinc-dependent peptidase [Marinicella meishanensis]|uniref:M90 family metallopeptidase n=1 Tax=Marinicella meishanensis TaxID=2873263 RepID=UPI001CBFB06B|nr:M90 family metallopeptidase [Marinicella sp. NBU2979]
MNQSYLIIISSVVAVLALLALLRWRKQRRRRMLFNLATPEHWVAYIERNVAIYHHLPDDLKRDLLGHVNVFLAEKYFTGHGDLEVTDEMRVTIAAQACVLLLGRPSNYYTHLRTIRIYPAGFKNPNHDKPGHHLGESWVRGPVVLSWADAEHGGRNAQDGHNVVIHEFAHQLDQADGAGDGRPIIEGNQLHTWGQLMSQEFKSLIAKAKMRRRSFFDHYGATNPAEFFAVTTEHFFEQPHTFKRKHPNLYALLQNYYRLDPSSWTPAKKQR